MSNSHKERQVPVVCLSDVEIMENGFGEVFSARLAPLGGRLGLRKLGAMITVVPPGKRAFPFRVHHTNDEISMILDGKGEYRYGEQTFVVRAGDACAAPAGGEAHQLINTGSADLRYLGISTMIDPEIVEYPDSNKFAAISVGEGNTFASARLRYVGRRENSLNYWDGEDGEDADSSNT